MSREVRFAFGRRRPPVRATCALCPTETVEELVWVIFGMPPTVKAVDDPNPPRDRELAMHLCERCRQLILRAGAAIVAPDRIAFGRRETEVDVSCQLCTEPTPYRLVSPQTFGAADGQYNLVPWCDRCMHGVLNAAPNAHALIPSRYY